MKSETKLKKSGFTLVELLVIIAIIGIISTTAVISLRQAREKAIESKLLQQMINYQKIAILCMYEGLELNCGSTHINPRPCNPRASDYDPEIDRFPILMAPLCGIGVVEEANAIGGRFWRDNWFINYDWEWKMSISNVAEASFCFMIGREDPQKFISCSSEICHITNDPKCFLPCLPIGTSCYNDSNCCSGLCEGSAINKKCKTNENPIFIEEV